MEAADRESHRCPFDPSSITRDHNDVHAVSSARPKIHADIGFAEIDGEAVAYDPRNQAGI